MQAHERVGLEPVAPDAVAAVDQGDAHVGVVDQRVGERHAHGPGPDHQVVGLDCACHLTTQPRGVLGRPSPGPMRMRSDLPMPATAIPTSPDRSVSSWGRWSRLGRSGRSRSPAVSGFSATSVAFTSESPLHPVLGRVRAPVERLSVPLSPRSAVLRRVAVPLTAGALSLTLGGWSLPRPGRPEDLIDDDEPGRCTPPPRCPTAPSWSPAGRAAGPRLTAGRDLPAHDPQLGADRLHGWSERWYPRRPPRRRSGARHRRGRRRQRRAAGSTEIYDANTGAWTETGALLEGRHEHTATTLRGRSGARRRWSGHAIAATRTSAWPAPRSSTPRRAPGRPAETWLAPRYGHTATLLEDGTVLVDRWAATRTGAWHRREIYDPDDRLLVTRRPDDRRTQRPHRHLLRDGKVLVTGGFGANSTLATGELYDPATRTWSATKPLRAPTKFHAATTLSDGRVLVAGGRTRQPPRSTPGLEDLALGRCRCRRSGPTPASPRWRTAPRSWPAATKQQRHLRDRRDRDRSGARRRHRRGRRRRRAGTTAPRSRTVPGRCRAEAPATVRPSTPAASPWPAPTRRSPEYDVWSCPESCPWPTP